MYKIYKCLEFDKKRLTQGVRRSRHREDRRSGQDTGGREGGEGAPQGERGAPLQEVQEGHPKGTGAGVQA